jgi:hypothetical protein
MRNNWSKNVINNMHDKYFQARATALGVRGHKLQQQYASVEPRKSSSRLLLLAAAAGTAFLRETVAVAVLAARQPEA